MKKKKSKLIGRLRKINGQLNLVINWQEYFKLITKALRSLVKDKYKPDLVISIAHGGWYGMIVASALGVPHAIWQACSYKDEEGTGKKRKKIYFTKYLLLINPKTGKPIYLSRKNFKFKHILIVDDLYDTGRTISKAKRLLVQWFGHGYEMRVMCLNHKKQANEFIDYIGQVIPSDPVTGDHPWIKQPHESLAESLARQIKHWRWAA